MNSISKKLNLLPLGNKIIPVKITDTMLDKIKYLCKCIPAHEWSGILFYSVEGSIKDIDNFKVTLEDVYPMDKGSQAFTAYEYDETIVAYRMDNPETLSMNMGHIHSHNTMQTFFSGTDNDELTDNAIHHNYYLSVIVNNYLDFTIRIAMIAKSQSIIYNVKDENGEDYNVNSPSNEEVVLYYNCKLEREVEHINVLESFALRVKQIIESSARRINELQNKVKILNDGFQGKNPQTFNHGNKSVAVSEKNKKKNKSFFKTDSQLQLALDDYQIAIESFLVGLLTRNHKKISTVNRELDSVLNLLVLNTRQDEFATYISETIGSYTDVYEEYFVKGPNIEVEFAEDLDSAIDMLAESKYSKSPLISTLINSLENFQRQYNMAIKSEQYYEY